MIRQSRQAFQDFERDAFNAVAPAYAAWAADKTSQVLPALLDAANVTPGVRVLDVATGPGYGAAAAAERGAHAIGVDLADEMVACARRTYPTVEFRVGAAEDLPVDSDSVDALISAFGLPHFADHVEAFREFRRVLRAGGTLAMSTWAPPDRNPFMALAFGGVALCGDPAAGDLPPGESPFAYADPDRCGADLAGAGFGEVQLSEVELDFAIDGARGMLRFLSEVGGRSKALFEAQTEAARASIRDFITERIAPYAGADGQHHVPAVAVIVAAAG